jgi:hypothetical protein
MKTKKVNFIIGGEGIWQTIGVKMWLYGLERQGIRRSAN